MLYLIICLIGILTTPDNRTQKLQNAIKQIIMLRIDPTEAACLKALILFRPGKTHIYNIYYNCNKARSLYTHYRFYLSESQIA